MEIVTSRLPEGARDVLARAMAAIAAALMILVTWQSVVVAFDQWDEKMASLEASAAWFIVAVAIGCAHSALHLILIVLDGRPAQSPDGGHGMSLLIILVFMGIALLGMPLAFALGHRRRCGTHRQRRRLQPAAHADDECRQRVSADVDPVLHPGRRADDEGRHHGAADRPRQCGRGTRARRARARHDARRARPVDGIRRGGRRCQRARQHADSVAAQVVRPRVLDRGGCRGRQPRPDHPAVGRDDRLCLHGRTHGLGGRHVHGGRGAGHHPRRR